MWVFAMTLTAMSWRSPRHRGRLMAAHRPPDRVETASEPVQEFLFEAAYSRRRFLVYSAAGAAGSFLIGGAPAGAGTVVPPPSGGTDRVIQPTPSWYFVHRENGSAEMKWGPVGHAGFSRERLLC